MKLTIKYNHEEGVMTIMKQCEIVKFFFEGGIIPIDVNSQIKNYIYLKMKMLDKLKKKVKESEYDIEKSVNNLSIIGVNE